MYERIKPEEQRTKAPQLRERFWDIFRREPDTMKSYANKLNMSYGVFKDFVMARTVLKPKNYFKFEDWVLEQENKGGYWSYKT